MFVWRALFCYIWKGWLTQTWKAIRSGANAVYAHKCRFCFLLMSASRTILGLKVPKGVFYVNYEWAGRIVRCVKIVSFKFFLWRCICKAYFFFWCKALVFDSLLHSKFSFHFAIESELRWLFLFIWLKIALVAMEAGGKKFWLLNLVCLGWEMGRSVYLVIIASLICSGILDMDWYINGTLLTNNLYLLPK